MKHYKINSRASSSSHSDSVYHYLKHSHLKNFCGFRKRCLVMDYVTGPVRVLEKSVISY